MLKVFLFVVTILAIIFSCFWLFNHVGAWTGIITGLILASLACWRFDRWLKN